VRTLWLALGLGCGVVGCSLVACAGDTPALCDDNACDANAEGGPEAASPTEAGADVVQPPAGCDPAADPKDAPRCVVSDFGVFVDAAAGADGNPGTKEAPVKSITAALGKLAGKTRLYLCDGTYPEHVKLSAPVSLYGGFACGSWSYSGAKAKLAPTGKGLALEIRAASADLVLADLDVSANDATEPGESSIAAMVASTTSATFRRTSLTAGKAVDGADGLPAADFAPAAAPDGTPGAGGGAATPNPACTTSIGGAGGRNASPNGANGGVAVIPVYPTGNTGGGGIAGATCGIPASDGAYGVEGTGGAGAAALGVLDASGWKGADGAKGGAGGNGQGGGGGAQRIEGGVGGSGGPGGCGGAGGASGTAGGSSIALLVFQSDVRLDQASLNANDAGRGGNAANGQKAQLGSANPGSPGSFASACAGGIGGVGGSGGGGGGGAGSLSVGILYKGKAPSLNGASTPAADTLPSVSLGAKGAPGAKGLGGIPAQPAVPISRPGQDGTEGTTGQAKAILAIP